MVKVANKSIGEAIVEKRKRPDGTDSKEYEKCKKWSPRRWAWEFLIRNEQFIEDCDAAEMGEIDKELVAIKYGLKKYKGYSEKLKEGAGTPKFLVGKISWIENLGYEAPKRSVKTILWMGQVLVRFNLRPALIDKNALQKQIESVKEHLEKWLVSYSAKYNITSIDHKPYNDNLITYLRILDILNSGRKSLDCAKILFPEMAKDLEAGKLKKFDLQDKVGSLVRSAKKMAKEGGGYLMLQDGIEINN